MRRAAALLALALVAGAPRGAAQEAPRRPNVLFLLSDDQRPDAIGALGNPELRTPHLDALAARGVAFRRAYCMGSTQGAVCVPSRQMIYSGRTLFRLEEPADAPFALLPQVFRAAGYATFFSGKWHAARPWLERSFERAAAVFFGGMGSHTALQVQDLGPDGAWGPRYPLPAFSSTTFADAAVRFLEGHDGARPFFVHVAFTAPHDPRTPPPEFAALYDPERLSLPPDYLPLHAIDNGEMVVRDERLAPWPRTPAVVRRHLADYYAMVSQLDHEVGRVLAAVAARGWLEDTVVVFASDHGLALGSHGLMGKQNLYEHSVGAPLVFAGPGVDRGGRSDAFAYLFDVFPTLCALCGLEAPPGVEGGSLVPALRGGDPALRDSVFTLYRVEQRAVRDARHKLIRYPLVDRTQLFDLAEDPHETRDLAGNPAHAATVARLLERMARWQRAVGDDAPLTVADPRPAAWTPPEDAGR